MMQTWVFTEDCNVLLEKGLNVKPVSGEEWG